MTIKNIRHLLGNRAGCIKTIIKVGYKFEEIEMESSSDVVLTTDSGKVYGTVDGLTWTQSEHSQ